MNPNSNEVSYREFSIAGDRAAQIDAAARIVRGVSVSSDRPYDRYFGTEILKHDEASVDLSRIKNSACPLLLNHERGAMIGKVLNPRLENGRLIVDLKFSKSARGAEALEELKDSILTEFSIGYSVTKFEVDEEEETYTATRWEIFEVSAVSIPADFSVGAGRQETQLTTRTNMNTPTTETPNRMTAVQREQHEKAIREWAEYLVKSKEQGRGFLHCMPDGFSIEVEAEKAIARGWTKNEFRKFVLDSMPEVTSATIQVPSDGEFDRHLANGTGGKTLGQLVTQSKYFIEFARRSGSFGRQCVIEIPARSIREVSERVLTQSGSGFAPADQRYGSVIVGGSEQPTVADLFAQGSASGSSVKYPREATFDDEAAEMVAEAAAKPLWDPDIEAASADVCKSAIVTKVSDEMLADAAATGAYLNARLPLLVALAEDRSLLLGDGVAPNHLGVLNTPSILAQSAATDVLDNCHRALTKIRTTGFFEPSAFVFHPSDFEKLLLMKDSENRYFSVGPFALPGGEIVSVQHLWGKPVIQTTAMTEGTALAGAFKSAGMLFRRQGIEIQMTNSNEDDFRKNLVALRAETRSALAVFYAAGFCEITNIA